MSAVLKPASPFPAPVRTVRHKPMHAVDVDMLKLEHNTPLPAGRRIVGKYDELFSRMKFGSCIACEQSEKENIANGLRKFLQRNKKPGKVVAVKRCEDGKARVWLVEK